RPAPRAVIKTAEHRGGERGGAHRRRSSPRLRRYTQLYTQLCFVGPRSRGVASVQKAAIMRPARETGFIAAALRYARRTRRDGSSPAASAEDIMKYGYR